MIDREQERPATLPYEYRRVGGWSGTAAAAAPPPEKKEKKSKLTEKLSPEMITEALPKVAEAPDTGAPEKQSRPKIKKTAKHPQ